MDKLKYMNTMLIGDKARVKEIGAGCAIRRRLMDIGLIENAEIECVGKSPLGDPSAYLIGGAVIAVRSRDCADILIEICGDGNGNN